MKRPDDRQLEALLRASHRETSASFEAALDKIPGREGKNLILFLKPLTIAAALILGLGFSLLQESRTVPVERPVEFLPQELDEEWISLLSLAEAVAPAGELTDPELRLVLEYYAFNP